MKKYVIIGILILLIGAMIIGPMLNDKSESTLAATFHFKDNLATEWNKDVELTIDINSDDIEKLELIYNDSVFHRWSNPSGTIKFPFDADFYGVGARTLVLQATMTDGKIEEDERMVRVLSDIQPEFWMAKIVGTYPHLTSSFTQGLEFNNGILFESTGQKGESKVAKVNLSSGNIENYIGLDATYFGEGITIVGDTIFQITWQEQKCFRYDKNSLQLLDDVSYTGEGWGLCNDGKFIIMSDGTERLYFRNPKSFTVERIIEVYDNRGPITNINELEYIDGKIYANIWMTNKAIVINADNGKVEAIIDGSVLEKTGRGPEGDVLNGIARNKQNGKIYFTGKKWSKLFEVEFEKPGL